MRFKLSDKYQKEREAICDKLISILELKEDHTFLLCELDNDIEKQQAILAMKDEIQQVFAVSRISSFRPHLDCKRPYLNIIRSVLRKQHYEFENSDYWEKFDNGLLKRTIKYKIFRNN